MTRAATGQLYALAVVAGTGSGGGTARSSQLAAMAVIAGTGSGGGTVRISALFAMATYSPTQSKGVNVSQLYALVPYAGAGANRAAVSQLFANIVYQYGVPSESRQRVWKFNIDGHPCFVLDLGDEGTFIYDFSSKQWSRFFTQGFTGWNMRNGSMFEGDRIAGGDTISGWVWEYDPSSVLDEGFRPIYHAVTGGIQTRTRTYHALDALRLTASQGDILDATSSTITLNYSDDNGHTWSDDFTVDVAAGDYEGETLWTSLGSFKAPGRIFRITDYGGLIRIDGLDAFLDGEDW